MKKRSANSPPEKQGDIFKVFVDNAVDGLLVIDSDGIVRFANPSAIALFAPETGALLGLHIGVPAIRESTELTVARPDGVRHLEMVATEILWEDKVASLASLRDVTDRNEAEKRVRRLTRVYALLSGVNSAIVRIKDARELLPEACRLAVRAGGFRIAWVGLVDPVDRRVKPVAWEGAGALDYLDSAPEIRTDREPGTGNIIEQTVTGRTVVMSNDIQNDPRTLMKREYGELGINSLIALPLVVDDAVAGVVALYASDTGFLDDEEVRLLTEVAGDISFALQHLKNEEKVAYLSLYDSLTGLPNRRQFVDRLGQLLSTEALKDGKLAVLVGDIERLRGINETLGRRAGDEFLRQLAQRALRHVTEPKWLARIGADHFASVISAVAGPDDVARRLEQVIPELFREPFEVDGTEVRTSMKVGIALYPGDGADPETLLVNAEVALRNAKQSGERYAFFARDMTARAGERLALENKLRQALEREEFVLHYQPKFDARTGAITGLEALIRWRSAELGLVPPAKFIGLMEETGIILQAGAWAMRRAALDHRRWAELGLNPPRVAVNVSAVQLRQRNFVGAVREALLSGVSPTAIDLEITESLMMEDVEGNIPKLNDLRALGIEIAIDDFGTGFSSLSYLAKLPVQALKIDRSFVVEMTSQTAAMTLVRTMISLAHSLGLKVIAEGVDAEEQAKYLRLLRCDQMQGYLFSRPVPFDEVAALLRG